MEVKGEALKRISRSATTLDLFTSQSRSANRVLSLQRESLHLLILLLLVSFTTPSQKTEIQHFKNTILRLYIHVLKWCLCPILRGNYFQHLFFLAAFEQQYRLSLFFVSKRVPTCSGFPSLYHLLSNFYTQ